MDGGGGGSSDADNWGRCCDQSADRGGGGRGSRGKEGGKERRGGAAGDGFAASRERRWMASPSPGCARSEGVGEGGALSPEIGDRYSRGVGENGGEVGRVVEEMTQTQTERPARSIRECRAGRESAPGQRKRSGEGSGQASGSGRCAPGGRGRLAARPTCSSFMSSLVFSRRFRSRILCFSIRSTVAATDLRPPAPQPPSANANPPDGTGPLWFKEPAL